MKPIAFFLSILLVSIGSGNAGAEDCSAIARKMKSIWSQEIGVPAKQKLIGDLYPGLVAAFPKNIRTAGTDELGLLMEAFNGIWFFLEDESIVEKAEKVFRELASRRFATADHLLAMQTIYVGAHRFKEAAQLREDYPEVDTWSVPPNITGETEVSSGPYRYYSIEAKGTALRLGRADLVEKPVIVFYGSPDCKFTVEALKNLPATPALKAALLAWGLFITDDNDFKELTAWNEKNPWKYVKVYSRKDWPAVKMAGAPEYTVFSQGSPVCYGRRWFEDKTAAEFTKCLETAGLLTDVARMRAAVSGVLSPAAGDLSFEETGKLIREEYESLKTKGAFEDSALDQYAEGDLAAVFDFLNFYATGNSGAEVAEKLLKMYARLEKAGQGAPQKGEWVYKALLAARNFEAAESFRLAHPELKLATVPEIKGETGLKPGEALVYVMGNSPDSMNAERVDKNEPQVIMVGLPGCHFCNYAFKTIEGDPKMLRIFKKHGQVLTSRADFEKIFKRNSAKELKYKLVASVEEWPGMDFTTSPSFYFLKDGKIIYTFSGWPKTGKMDELYVGLGRLGFLAD